MLDEDTSFGTRASDTKVDYYMFGNQTEPLPGLNYAVRNSCALIQWEERS